MILQSFRGDSLCHTIALWGQAGIWRVAVAQLTSREYASASNLKDAEGRVSPNPLLQFY